MATSVRLIRRYVWLVDTILRAKRITLEEINRKWRENVSLRLEDEDEIPPRTFHHHREAISNLFGIEILCDRSGGNVYYIKDEEMLESPGFSSWLFNGLSIFNQLQADQDISKRVCFERTSGGREYLSQVIDGMEKRKLLKISYRSYNNPTLKEYLVEPYGLKQSSGRWYLISHIPDFESLTVFALDRIESMTITEESFDFDKDLEVNSYFDEVIGVNLEDEYDVEDVRLRIYGHQRHYIESLPLHKSQKLEKREKEFSEYSFRLRPEYEFQHEILKIGRDAEVLSPQWLREEMEWQAEEMLKRYKPKA